jgi:hypothetical protein
VIAGGGNNAVEDDGIGIEIGGNVGVETDGVGMVVDGNVGVETDGVGMVVDGNVGVETDGASMGRVGARVTLVGNVAGGKEEGSRAALVKVEEDNGDSVDGKMAADCVLREAGGAKMVADKGGGDGACCNICCGDDCTKVLAVVGDGGGNDNTADDGGIVVDLFGWLFDGFDIASLLWVVVVLIEDAATK